MKLSRSRSRLLIFLVLAATLAGAGAVRARQAAARAGQILTVIAPDGRHQLPASASGDQLMVALEDVAPLFSLSIREDRISGALSVTTANGKRILMTPGQALASAEGRLVSLPAPLTRDGSRWLVPVEFLPRALAVVLNTRIEIRRGSGMVLVGDLRVPRVNVRFQEVGGIARLTLSVVPRAGHQIVAEQNRLLVRFDAEALDPTLPAVTPGPVLQGIRVGEPRNTLVLDLGPRFGSYRASATTRDTGSEVVIQLAPAAALPVPAAPPAAPAAPPGPLPQVATVQNASVRTVVIDAGHGAEEAGSSAADGTTEKEITLAIARRLRAALERRLGMRVLMTRDADENVSLDERAALANTNKADLFVSIHANASLRPSVRGAQVYYSSAGQTGEEARRAALAGQSLPTIGGGTRDVELILWESAQVRHLGESAAFAGIIEDEFRSRLAVTDRPILQAPFRVLAAANMPAVLVEVGFLSNPEEAAQLKSAQYQESVAQALLQSIVRFRDLVAGGGLTRQGGQDEGQGKADAVGDRDAVGDPEGSPYNGGRR